MQIMRNYIQNRQHRIQQEKKNTHSAPEKSSSLQSKTTTHREHILCKLAKYKPKVEEINCIGFFFVCFFFYVRFAVAKLRVFNKDRFSLCVHILIAVVAKINATKTMHLNLRSIGLMQHSLFTHKKRSKMQSFIHHLLQ